MNKTFVSLLVMMMLIMSLPCNALAEATAAPTEHGAVAEPEEVSEEPGDTAVAMLPAERLGAANMGAICRPSCSF